MRKLLFIMVSLVFLLFACADEAKNEDGQAGKENEETSLNEDSGDSEETEIEEDELREIVESSVAEGDELVSLSIEEGEVHAVVNLAANDSPRPFDVAISRYSDISGKLLTHGGWEVLTVEFSDVGTISIDRSESQENELGVFFPTKLIEEKFE